MCLFNALTASCALALQTTVKLIIKSGIVLLFCFIVFGDHLAHLA